METPNNQPQPKPKIDKAALDAEKVRKEAAIANNQTILKDEAPRR